MTDDYALFLAHLTPNMATDGLRWPQPMGLPDDKIAAQATHHRRAK